VRAPPAPGIEDPGDVIVCIGDWEQKKQMKFKEPTIGKGCRVAAEHETSERSNGSLTCFKAGFARVPHGKAVEGCAKYF